MDKKLLICVLVLGCLVITEHKKKGTAGLNDPQVSLDNIRRGVANGWYTCKLVRTSDGIPAVRLSGKNTDGKYYSDVYPVSEETWQTLKNDGYGIQM